MTITVPTGMEWYSRADARPPDEGGTLLATGPFIVEPEIDQERISAIIGINLVETGDGGIAYETSRPHLIPGSADIAVAADRITGTYDRMVVVLRPLALGDAYALIGRDVQTIQELVSAIQKVDTADPPPLPVPPVVGELDEDGYVKQVLRGPVGYDAPTKKWQRSAPEDGAEVVDLPGDAAVKLAEEGADFTPSDAWQDQAGIDPDERFAVIDPDDKPLALVAVAGGHSYLRRAGDWVAGTAPDGIQYDVTDSFVPAWDEGGGTMTLDDVRNYLQDDE